MLSIHALSQFLGGCDKTKSTFQYLPFHDNELFFYVSLQEIHLRLKATKVVKMCEKLRIGFFVTLILWQYVAVNFEYS